MYFFISYLPYIMKVLTIQKKSANSLVEDINGFTPLNMKGIHGEYTIEEIEKEILKTLSKAL
ncbi:hypothetical protein BBD41_09625 [Paenibacillus ihbetae]|uniref:Uncharacterized protein n=1 Tax=Paenibacillus ihbetae TaxID=1870820 RepID=A0A1B2DYJ7_9BACL|nr:hypothetical protein BBD41_09625 [Paenibacillus ihbetae]